MHVLCRMPSPHCVDCALLMTPARTACNHVAVEDVNLGLLFCLVCLGFVLLSVTV